jgi:Zn-finger protein
MEKKKIVFKCQDKGYAFFQNKQCPFLPCHKLGSMDIEDFNCLFCFCPLFHLNDCNGNYLQTLNGKDCSQCIFPHKRENYDKIISRL